MATYILMTKLGPGQIEDLKNREQIGREWHQRIKAACPEVKFVAHYALLGSFDFMDIYEAPDEITAAKVSFITQSMGATNAESWTAIPYARFLEVVQDV